MAAQRDVHERFLDLSAVLTGFSTFDLGATGQSEAYLATVEEVIGEENLDELLDAFDAARQEGQEAGHGEADEAAREEAAEAGSEIDDGAEHRFDRALRRAVLSDPKLGPIARRLVKLWYVGIWYELPEIWREQYGRTEADRTRVVSPQAYQEGLLWPAVGANPPGAKPFGFGIWANPPRIQTQPSNDTH